MLRYFGSTIGLSLLCLAGCGDPNAGARFIDTQYTVRCDMAGHCDGPYTHDICGFADSDACASGDPSPAVSCTVTESDTMRVIGFSALADSSASADSRVSISVQNLSVTTGSTAAMGGACRVTVQEGANTYSGACGPNTPSASQPCQITNISFCDDMGNPTLKGDIFCQFLANSTNPTFQVEVTAPGTGPAAAMTAAHFRVANCSGLRDNGLAACM